MIILFFPNLLSKLLEFAIDRRISFYERQVQSKYVYVWGAKNPVSSFCTLVNHFVKIFCGYACGVLYSWNL